MPVIKRSQINPIEMDDDRRDTKDKKGHAVAKTHEVRKPSVSESSESDESDRVSPINIGVGLSFTVLKLSTRY